MRRKKDTTNKTFVCAQGLETGQHIKDVPNLWVTCDGRTVICCGDNFLRIFLTLFLTKAVCTANDSSAVTSYPQIGNVFYILPVF